MPHLYCTDLEKVSLTAVHNGTELQVRMAHRSEQIKCALQQTIRGWRL